MKTLLSKIKDHLVKHSRTYDILLHDYHKIDLENTILGRRCVL